MSYWHLSFSLGQSVLFSVLVFKNFADVLPDIILKTVNSYADFKLI